MFPKTSETEFICGRYFPIEFLHWTIILAGKRDIIDCETFDVWFENCVFGTENKRLKLQSDLHDIVLITLSNINKKLNILLIKWILINLLIVVHELFLFFSKSSSKNW